MARADPSRPLPLRRGDRRGDFGYGFWSGPLGSEDAFYDWLAAQPYAVFFIDGNHENFDRLLALPVEPWRGGRIQRIRPNVIHLMRGEVYLIEGRTVFTFGGGHSADFWRRKPGASWWPQEMPGAGGVPPRVGEPAPRPWPGRLHRHARRPA